MNIQIKHRLYGTVLFETDAATLGDAIRAALASKANLSKANLSWANLSGANLSKADLSKADLSKADLSGADLSGADLSWANLSKANLSGADLSKANLSWANLSGANLSKLLSQRSIVADGDIIGWKKLNNGTVAKLRIPEAAQRIGGLVGRKCRAEYAIVLEGEGFSSHDNSFQYKKGATVKPDKYDPNPVIECSHGIHFFITKAEAEAY